MLCSGSGRIIETGRQRCEVNERKYPSMMGADFDGAIAYAKEVLAEQGHHIDGRWVVCNVDSFRSDNVSTYQASERDPRNFVVYGSIELTVHVKVLLLTAEVHMDSLGQGHDMDMYLRSLLERYNFVLSNSTVSESGEPILGDRRSRRGFRGPVFLDLVYERVAA